MTIVGVFGIQPPIRGRYPEGILECSRRSLPEMYERFTDRARKVMQLANQVLLALYCIARLRHRSDGHHRE
jgi:hypothetical protein